MPQRKYTEPDWLDPGYMPIALYRSQKHHDSPEAPLFAMRRTAKGEDVFLIHGIVTEDPEIILKALREWAATMTAPVRS